MRSLANKTSEFLQDSSWCSSAVCMASTLRARSPWVRARSWGDDWWSPGGSLPRPGLGHQSMVKLEVVVVVRGGGGGVAAVDTTIHCFRSVWLDSGLGNRYFSQKHQFLHGEQNGACWGRNKHRSGLLEVILSGMHRGADHSSTADLFVKLWCPDTIIHTVLETQSFCSGGADDARIIVRK